MDGSAVDGSAASNETEYQGTYFPRSEYQPVTFRHLGLADEENTLSQLQQVMRTEVSYTLSSVADVDAYLNAGTQPKLDAPLCASFLGNMLCMHVQGCTWIYGDDGTRSLQIAEDLEWPIDHVLAKKLYNEMGLLRSAYDFIGLT